MLLIAHDWIRIALTRGWKQRHSIHSDSWVARNTNLTVLSYLILQMSVAFGIIPIASGSWRGHSGDLSRDLIHIEPPAFVRRTFSLRDPLQTFARLSSFSTGRSSSFCVWITCSCTVGFVETSDYFLKTRLRHTEVSLVWLRDRVSQLNGLCQIEIKVILTNISKIIS